MCVCVWVLRKRLLTHTRPSFFCFLVFGVKKQDERRWKESLKKKKTFKRGVFRREIGEKTRRSQRTLGEQEKREASVFFSEESGRREKSFFRGTLSL